MFGAGQIRVDDAATALGIDLGAGELIEEAVSLGYNPGSARQAMRWTVGRIALHAGIQHVSEITNDHIIEVLDAIRLFSERADLSYFNPSAQNYRDNAAKQWITHLHQLQVVLFHRGQVATQPRKLMPSWKPLLVLPPQMQAVADKWLAARRLTDAPATVEKLEIAIRRFGEGLTEHPPRSSATPTSPVIIVWPGPSLSPKRRPRRPANHRAPSPGSNASPGCRRCFVTPRLGSTTTSPGMRLLPPVTRPSCRSGFPGSSPTTNSTW